MDNLKSTLARCPGPVQSLDRVDLSRGRGPGVPGPYIGRRVGARHCLARGPPAILGCEPDQDRGRVFLPVRFFFLPRAFIPKETGV